MIKVLMVCLGNICRSPLAEGVLRSKVDASAVFVDSSGTSGHHSGESPDKRSIAIASVHGIDITNQRSRKFVIDDFDNFDYIYVMDRSNYLNVIDMARTKDDSAKVKMILNELSPGTNANVPDPYFGGSDGFELVYQLLDQSCEIIANKLIN